MPKAFLISGRSTVLRALLGAVLGPEYELLASADPMDGLSDLRRHRIQLVVLDFCTCDQSCHPVLQRILPPQGRPALLGVVSLKETERLRSALATGLDGWIVDPFDLEQFESAVRNAIRARATASSRIQPVDALATFLRAFAHKLRNPMSNVSAVLRLLLPPDTTKSPDHQGYAQTIQNELERIGRLVEELELMVGAHHPKLMEISFRELLRDLEEQCKDENLPLQIQDRLSGSVPSMLAEHKQLVLALRMLVRYAAGLGVPGVVALEVFQVQQRVHIEIRGTRDLNLPDTLERLFLPGEDLHGTGRPGGLELAVAYRIIQMHQGLLEATKEESNAIRFLISFASQAASPVAAVGKPPADPLPHS